MAPPATADSDGARLRHRPRARHVGPPRRRLVDAARFHADAEAVHSYEGTHEINALVVGRPVTGLGAFTR